MNAPSTGVDDPGDGRPSPRLEGAVPRGVGAPRAISPARAASGARIAFVRMAPHPIPNRLLPPELEAAFPDGRVDVIDVGAVVRRDPLTWLVNPFFMLREHSGKLLRGALNPRQAFFTTSFAFRRMSRAGRRVVSRGGYLFSFQIQSLFDAHSDGTPHFVYTDHTHLTNLDYPDFDERLLRCEAWMKLERRLYRDAARLFTRSENVSRTLVERYDVPAERVVCVGAGTNARPPETAPVRAADAPARILFVGRDWQRKGGPELIEAFRRVRERHPEVCLCIVGSSPDVDAPGVEVVPQCPVEEIHRHYAEASIFCLPSRLEPFGVAYLEAMHHGLPVIGTRMGAVPELVEDGVVGFVVDVGDVDALSDRLERLVADASLCREMGARAARRARERYTWRAVAMRMVESIRGVVGDASPDEAVVGGRQSS